MKKVVIGGLFLCLALSSPVYAQAKKYVACSTDKAKQGFTNIITGWLEIPYQVVKGYNNGLGQENKNKPLGGAFGIFRGVIHGVGRTTSGAYELATFALPNPKSNAGVGIPLDSKNVWEEGTQYSLLQSGIAPMGKKAKRGIINTVFGVLDFPGQISKGFSEDKPFKGVAKGILFPLGRITSGVYDMVTFFLPNDIESYGYPLSEKYPWDGFEKDRWNNAL